jgi:hypothetical protein
MKKRYTKKNTISNKKNKNKKHKYTRKIRYGGEISEVFRQKNAFRTELINLINKINEKSSRNLIKDVRNMLIKFFSENKQMINILIPITVNGEPIVYREISRIENPKKVYDYVSIVIILLNKLSNILSIKDLEILLNAYFKNGGNINNLSSRFKLSPFKNELNKKRVENVRMLLNNSNPFHILEDGLDDETKIQLAELIPNEQKIETINVEPLEKTIQIKEPLKINEPEQIKEEIVAYPKLQLPYPLPLNNDIGYDRDLEPEFWKPIFGNEANLLKIREKFMSIYELDKYTSNEQKRIKFCDILERLVPSYLTLYSLNYGQSAKTLVNVNILNCLITILLGMVLNRLYETKQEFIFIFKGGRALQLSLKDIQDIGKYFSEDTDVLIIPNKYQGTSYNFSKMENLSAHIGYLIKWFVPKEINIIVSLPTNPKNVNKDITKLVYNDGKIFKAISDIGFGEIPHDIKPYFENFDFTNFNVEELNQILLFICPTIDDMLSEKLYFYAKYLIFKELLEKNEPINEKGYMNLTKEDCDFYIYKFKRAIYKLVEGILKKDYSNTEDLNKRETSKLILRGIIGNFDDYSNEQKEKIIQSIYSQ